MTTTQKIALHAGFEQCEESDPQAQFVDGYFYRPKLGRDSIWTVLKALEHHSYKDAQRHFAVSCAEVTV